MVTAGQVTVATRMAGRGTDIALDAAARAAGGLHVLSCQHNKSRRHDRQLAGRAGRQGDPGSAEFWLSDRPSLSDLAPAADMQTPCKTSTALSAWSHAAPAIRHWTQWQEERRRAGLRRQLLAQDLAWEQKLSFAGRRG